MSGLVTIAVLNTIIHGVENKILHTSCLMTTAILNAKIGEVKNRIADVRDLVNKAVYYAKKRHLGKIFNYCWLL